MSKPLGATVDIGDKYLDESYVEKMLGVLKMTRIVERIYKDGREEGKEEGKQEDILTYLETRFGLDWIRWIFKIK
ncbi:hypothetical protein SAMN04488123_101418 [Natribacillus halophilus]|uniref:Uncharacterized protein n=1 Tax=Natribacillus halophilus TaxID=549003 RepID=A0A1G8JVN5_9BACI|nr:hypothetical protein SAMN04488123_101418 [Natribacillus halophilus]